MTVTSDTLIGLIAAWIVVIFTGVIYLSLIYILVFGGTLEAKAEGLLPKIKRWSRHVYRRLQ